MDVVEGLADGELVKREVLQGALEAANLLGQEQEGVEEAVRRLNRALRGGRPQVR